MTVADRKYQEIVIPSKIERLLSMINHGGLNLERHMKKNNLTKAESNNQIRQSLLQMKKRMTNNHIKVEYQFTVPKFGRVYVRKPYYSIGSLPREIRGTLASDYYVDIDINNCHPVLLVQLCDSYKIECSALQDYVNNRDEYLKRVMDEYECSRDDAKVLFLELMYGGSYQTWASSIGTDKKEFTWITDLVNSIKHVYPELLKHYEDKVKLLEENGKPEKKTNREAALVSWILQDIERQILDTMLDYISRYGLKVSNCVLCFDGFMMLKEKYTPSLLAKIESYVKQKTGYFIQLSTKEFTTIDLSDLEEDSSYEEYIAPQTDFFDIQVFNEASNYSWESAKEYFERFACYNEDGDNIAFYNAIKREVEFISDKQRKSRFANLLDYVNLNSKNAPTPFIKKWLECSDRKTAHKVEFIPYSGSFKQDKWFCDGVINTFSGFNKSIEFVDESHRQEFDNFYENSFLKLVNNLCEGNEEYAEWFLQFFAHIIQKPNVNVGRAIILIGNQGDGKNAILDTFANVFGKHLYNSSAKMSDYFGNIASAHYQKILVNLDEAQKAGNIDLEGKIKEFITKPDINVRKMYQDTFTTKNYARLVVTTNYSSALPIDFSSGDRRFVIFRTGNPYESNKCAEYIKFWNEYHAVINSEWFPGLMYEKMMSIDLSDWNPQKKIVSKQYKETLDQCGTSADHFFNDKCMELYTKALENVNKNGGGIPTKVVYDMYKEYCEENGYKIINNKSFISILTSNIAYSKFLTRKRESNTWYYRFKLSEILDYINSLNTKDKSGEEKEEEEDNTVWTDDEEK